MFSCKDSINLLLEFLEGDMRPEDRKELEEHLHGCPPCEDFLKSYRATSGMCKKALVSRMPDELARKLSGFLRERIKKP
jgi:anti-sigma factor RsiW